LLTPHRGYGKRFIVLADEKLTAFLELEAAIRFALRFFEIALVLVRFDHRCLNHRKRHVIGCDASCSRLHPARAYCLIFGY
jgi:hypothetical protein